MATITNTYYINESNKANENPYGDWVNPENIYDGDINTYGYTSYFYYSHMIMAGGTNSPTTGGEIYTVRARVLCGSNIDAPAWSEYVSLDTPTTGWTWEKISHLFAMSFPNYPFMALLLRTVIFDEDHTGQQLCMNIDAINISPAATQIKLYKIEIEVTSEEVIAEFPYAQLYPIMGLTVRGRFGHLWIHKLYKERYWNNHPDYPQNPDRYKMAGSQGRVITKYYYPENPRTARQQGNRSTFSDGLYNWSQFDKNTKNYYDELKRPIYAYGIHRYISLYMLANPNMIIYWNSLEKSATDPARLPDYMASEYFGGVSRVLASATYPASSPYGALRYRSDLKKFVGFKQDSGWGEIGGGGGVGGGDVTGPATNNADYIPQWNGTDSKTLKNGLPVNATPTANNIPVLDGSALMPAAAIPNQTLITQVFS